MNADTTKPDRTIAFRDARQYVIGGRKLETEIPVYLACARQDIGFLKGR